MRQKMGNFADAIGYTQVIGYRGNKGGTELLI